MNGINNMITSFYGVFKDRYNNLKNSLESELKRSKSERRKDWMKSHIKQMKSLKHTLKEMDDALGLSKCPNCGHNLK